MAPPVGGVAVAGPHRVAVAALAVHLLAPVRADRVVADEQNRPGGPELPDDEPGQQRGEAKAGPLGLGEDLVVAGGSPVAEPADETEEVADGAAAGAEDAGDGQQSGAGEDGGGEGGANRERMGMASGPILAMRASCR